MARICWAISEGESATDRFWQTTQRSSLAISRVRSSRSGEVAAWRTSRDGTNRTYMTNRADIVRIRIGLSDRLVVAFAFRGADNAFGCVVDCRDDQRYAGAYDL